MFEEFNQKINYDELQKQIEGSRTNNREVTKGSYRVKLNKLEIGECGPKASLPGAPILKADFVIIDGEFRKFHLFENKVLYTDRTDDKWNIGKLIGGVLGWIETLEPAEEIEVAFENYDQFSDLVAEIFEDVAELEYEVEYDPDGFYRIKITDVIE